MATSPNTDNYTIGKGIVTFDRADGGSPRDVGNCPSFKLTPALTKLDHFSSRAGTKKKDKSVVTESAFTLSMQLDEITDENLALAMMGDVPSGGSFDLMAVSEISGTVSFTGTNDVGSLITWSGEVSFIPKEGVDLISDGWMVITLEGECLADTSTGTFGTMSVADQSA